MKNILITGGVGFIGSNLAKKLVKKNYNVTSIDDYSFGSKKNEIDGVEYIKEDINNISYLKTKFDICFHLAALARVQLSFKDPAKYFKSNVNGTERVMEWAKENKVKVVYAGSSSRHFNPSDSPYAMYKFLGEEICKLYKKSFDLNVEIARFYNVYGPGEVVSEVNGNVIGIWRSKIKENKPLTIVGDGNQRRDFTHVFDIVDGLIKIAMSNLKSPDAWELGTGNNYSVNELFEMFRGRFDVKPEYVPDQPGNYKKTLRKNDDMLLKLDWKPKDRLKEHIQTLDL